MFLNIYTSCSGTFYGLSRPLLRSAYSIEILVSHRTRSPASERNVHAYLTDSVALMAIPELYRYSREGLWFGAIPFSIFMMEGVYQVRVHLPNIPPILVAD